MITDEYFNYTSGFFLTDRIPMDLLYLADMSRIYDFIEANVSEVYQDMSAEKVFEQIEDMAEYLQMSVDIKPEYLCRY